MPVTRSISKCISLDFFFFFPPLFFFSFNDGEKERERDKGKKFPNLRRRFRSFSIDEERGERKFLKFLSLIFMISFPFKRRWEKGGGEDK